jgi:CRP/FNR family transcriptional regulator, cyclic AMP receptor protein
MIMTSSDLIEQIRLFSGLNPQQMVWVSSRLHTRTLPENTDLLIAGGQADMVYFILGGTVKVYVSQLDGKEVIVNIMGPGDTVGELSAIDSGGHSASVVTLEETQVAWMSREDFREAIHTIPPISDNLIRSLTMRVRITTGHIQAYASLSVPGRIARQILVIASNYGQPHPQGIAIPLRLTQGDIAELVGASRKRVNQVMVALKRDGILSFDSNAHILIFNKDALEKMAEGNQPA